MSAVTPAFDFPNAARIGLHGGIGVITGIATLATYETSGGVDCDISTPFETLYHVNFNVVSGYVPGYDYTNDKLLVWEAGADAAALDEVGDGALALVFRFSAIGKVPI